jgi:hypothetical protein
VKRLAVTLAVVAASAAAVACSSPTPAGDPFPIHVDMTQGPVLVHVALPGDAGAPLVATLDVLAPFTLIDPGPDGAVERDSNELALLGQRTPGSTSLVPRASFAVDLVRLHPCDPSVARCTVGNPAAPVAIDAVVGGDALSSSAIRFDFPASDLYVLPDIAGGNDLRDLACEAVFPSPYRGGGTLVLGGADVDFSGRRVAIGACLGNPTAAKNTGTDVLLVASTGLGPTLLGTSAYERYCRAQHGGKCEDMDAVTALPRATALLPSGPITGGATSIKDLALVAAPEAVTTAGSHGPCADLHASHCIIDATCCDQCTDTSCGAPATVELSPVTPITVIVVDDADPTLQALRAELRPDQAEVDGILGVDAMRALRVDFDYPHNRALIRCGPGQAGCTVRPQLAGFGFQKRVHDCVAPGSMSCPVVP